MKKILASVLAAACIFTAAVPFAESTVIADGFIIESDAQVAMEKNQKAVLEYLEKTEITNDITKDELESIVMGVCDYSTNEYVGAGILVDNYRLIKATASKAGLLKAEILIYQNDGEVGFAIEKEIPKLGRGTETDLNNTQTDLQPETEEDEEDNNISDTDAKKEIEAAYKAINNAMWEFEVSNDTSKNDILNMAKNALPDGSHVRVTLDDSDFSMVKASTTVTGTVSATLGLKCGGVEKRIPAAKTVPKVITEVSTKIDEDVHEIGVAINSLTYTNKITKESMLETALAAVKNGVKASWESFTMKKATFEEKGDIIGYLNITLDEETRSIRIQKTIPMLVRKMPSDKISINKDEWEILRAANVERAKEGMYLFTTIAGLQDTCDVREKELVESYSHTRPNGEKCFTALPDSLRKLKPLGENIIMDCSGDLEGKKCVESWMNSPGHRANILNSSFGCMGVGLVNQRGVGRAVQMFTKEKTIESVTTSAGTMSFEDEEELQKEYLICTMSDGEVSYMPLDIAFMQKSGNTYTAKIQKEGYAVFTVGEDGRANESKAPENQCDANNSIIMPTVPTFTDVSSDAYYANAVKWAVNKKITAGTSSTTFSPNDTCTRAQILTFLWRAVGSPKSNAANPFSDVKNDAYYCDAAIWASEKGMVTGSVFNGDTPCTRSSTVTYLWQNAGEEDVTADKEFNDVPSGSDYAMAIAWAVSNGVTSGTSDTTFSPDEICSRGQIVTFLNRALNN